MQKQKKQMCHILLIYYVMIPSVRLCGHSQMENLAERGILEYRAVQLTELKSGDLHWADVVLLGRLDGEYEYRLARELQSAGKYLIYMIDDDLLNIPPEISSAEHYAQEEIRKSILGMIEISNAILSPSPVLLGKYATNGKKAILLEEPAMDPIDYTPHTPEIPIKIGFAGSIDRTGDIENILRDALIQIEQEYGKRVEFEFFGAIPSFAKRLGAKCIPYQNSYEEYRKTLNRLQWDIGLAPMPDQPFYAAKHYNKFIEYAAAGVVGVYSDVMPYTRIHQLKLKECGLFNENKTEQWYQSIKLLIDDYTFRETLRERVCVYAHKELSVEHIANELLSEISDILDYRAPKGVYRYDLNRNRTVGIFQRTVGFIKKHKLHAFGAAAKKIHAKLKNRVR